MGSFVPRALIALVSVYGKTESKKSEMIANHLFPSIRCVCSAMHIAHAIFN